MAAEDENVHPFTLDWWGHLPWAYRDADGRQGYQVGPPWHGLNRDPRFVTGWDGWDRTNTSSKAHEASVALTRRFNVEPGAPVLLRSWHSPAQLAELTDTTSEVGTAAVGLMELGETTTTVRVRHTVRNHTGLVVSEKVVDLTGSAYQVLDTWWTADRFGVMHATVEVTVNVPGFMDALNAIHVGTREALFEELPDLPDFTVARPYPLLRYLDGVGHQAGELSDTVEQMHAGGWTDPATAPPTALPYLSAVLGLPTDYAGTLSTAQLREHLVGLVDDGGPTAGTAAAVTSVAKRWLTGDKQLSVIPGVTPGAYPSQAESDLMAAMGMPGAVLVQGEPPVPPRPDIYWEGAQGASASVWTVDGVRRWENLEPNGSFTYPPHGWGASIHTIGQDIAHAYEGTVSLKVTPAPSSAASSVYGPYRTPLDGSEVVRTARVYTPVPRTMILTAYVEGDGLAPFERVEVPANRWVSLAHRHTPDPAKRHQTWIIASASDDPWWLDTVTEARALYAPDDYFDGDTPEPTPAVARDVWVDSDATVATPHVFNTATWVWDPRTGYDTQAQAVLDTWETHQFEAAHTLLLLCRADEVPNQDLAAFEAFLNDSGVVPAGHQVVTRTASPTWAQWQTFVGDTWETMHARAPRWVDHHSAGITI